jgi:hypothetical protein
MGRRVCNTMCASSCVELSWTWQQLQFVMLMMGSSLPEVVWSDVMLYIGRYLHTKVP